MKRFTYGPWVPDLPPLVNQQGCTVARNVVPIGGGYGPQRSLVTVTGASALDEYARGAVGGIDFGGNAYNFAGDENKLYRETEVGAVDVSRAAGYSTLGSGRWDFAVFGEKVFATNYVDQIQFYDVRAGADEKFSNVSDLPNAPAVPRARHIGVIDSFLVAGNLFDPIDGNQPDAISWATINNPLSWPERGTDLAVASQSDKQRLEGNGGWVNAVVAGAEVGAVFQEHAVWRMEYVGGDVVFALRRVEPNRGLLIPRLAVAVSRFVFYCSEDGFYLFDYTQSRPIGKDRVNRTFLADVDQSNFHRVSAVRDPDHTRIYVLYPGTGNVDGLPNKLLVYDWALDQFSESQVTAEMLCLSVVPGVNLDSPDTVDDPDLLGDGIPLGDETFDEPLAGPGAAVLSAYDSSHVLASFTGVALPGTIETGDMEVNPGSRSMINSVRPLVDSADATVQVAAASRRNEALQYGRISEQDEDGKCPVRVDGRYHRFRVNLPKTFTSATGIDVDGRPSGMR